MGGEQPIFLGSITKTHGISGELLVRSPAMSYSLTDSWDLVFIEIDRILVPFFIESFHQLDNHTLILNIRDINDKNTASAYLKKKVHVPRSAIRDTGGSIADPGLDSYTVIDTEKGELGRIVEHIGLKDNPLFLVTDGKNQFYLPASKELISRIDTRQKKVFVTMPEGIVDSQK
jgi:16S rRNA processing protein RimM